MKMNKLETLQATYKMWSWLAENPGMGKAEYFYYHRDICDIETPNRYACYLCDYAIGRMEDEVERYNYLTNSHCQKHCPLIDHFNEGAERVYTCPCEDNLCSSYSEWCNGLCSPEISTAAQRLADACLVEIKKIKDEEGK